MYSVKDDDGTSYVFAGENPNNWVKLGNLYFRIIRFNGNGTMRLIFSGDGSPEANGYKTQIQTNMFNEEVTNDNMNVGLQYTKGNAHGTGINSIILGTSTSTDAKTLYGWYNSKIKPSYSSIIDTNVGFCSDRQSYTDSLGTTLGGGTGTLTSHYRAKITYHDGWKWRKNFTPDLTCLIKADRLKLPVGLITADEYMLAGGGVSGNGIAYFNRTFWLHTGVSYWTMTPAYFRTNDNAHVFYASGSGYILYQIVHYANNGVRPVINLKSTTRFTNNGTGPTGSSTNPYEVIVN